MILRCIRRSYASATATPVNLSLHPEELMKLKEKALTNVVSIMELDTDSLEQRKEILSSIESFGLQTMRTSSDKSSLMQVSVGALAQKGDEGDLVSKGLSELKVQLDDLDPSLIDFTKTGLFGKFFNPLRAYFQKYQKADEVISDIVLSLEKGKNTLKNDNTTLEIEQHAMRALCKLLKQEMQLGAFMDEAIEAQLEAAQQKRSNKRSPMCSLPLIRSAPISRKRCRRCATPSTSSASSPTPGKKRSNGWKKAVNWRFNEKPTVPRTVGFFVSQNNNTWRPST